MRWDVVQHIMEIFTLVVCACGSNKRDMLNMPGMHVTGMYAVRCPEGSVEEGMWVCTWASGPPFCAAQQHVPLICTPLLLHVRSLQCNHCTLCNSISGLVAG